MFFYSNLKTKLIKIVGEHISTVSLFFIIDFHALMRDVLLFTPFTQPPPVLIRVCTAYNCVCWQNEIDGFCIAYNVCLKCYNGDCIRSTKGHLEKCVNNIKKKI